MAVRVEVDAGSETMKYKIREAQLQKVPYMLVVGDKEASGGTVSVRSRVDGDRALGQWRGGANAGLRPHGRP